jgi:peptidyl-prolyl cis-trans isomerase D
MITMMRRSRKALQVGLLIVVASFVASLFLFGSGRFGAENVRDSVATVNGEPIPMERYQRRYQAYVEAYSQIYRDRFSPELAEKLGLPQQVVNDLVQEAVVVQRARAEGLEVTDEELNAQIQAIPAFLEGGRFALKRYEELLRQRGMSAAKFENDVRRELTRVKVENLVRSAAKVSDAEVEKAFAVQHEGVRAAWVLIELAPLTAAATATDAEAETYLKQHGAEFRLPDRRRVQYVLLSPKDFTRPVSDADAEKYYQEHASEFEMPREVRVSHLLVRVPETGGSAAEDKAKAKVADAIRRVKAGEPFAKVVKEVSEDPGSAQNGGDLGFVRKGEMVPAFEKAVFALQKGEISPEPVRTPFGFHAIKVEDVRAGGKKPLKEVAAQIKDKLSSENADRAARAKADEIKPPLQVAPDFMAEAKKLGLSPLETKVSKIESPVGLPRGDSMEETAFSLAVGGVSSPLKTPAGYIVLKALETLPAAVPPMSEIKDQVIAAVKREKAEGGALARAKQIATEAKTGDLIALGKKAGAATGETPAFSRAKPAERLPGDAMLAALKTLVGGVTDPIKTAQGYYVLKVQERVPADTSDFEKERQKVSQDLVAQKQSQVWENWVSVARAKAKIEISSQPHAPRRG